MVTVASSESFMNALPAHYSGQQIKDNLVMVRVGCGSGNEALAVCSVLAVRLLVLVEIEPQNLAVARQALAQHSDEVKASQVMFVLGDATQLSAQVFISLAELAHVDSPCFSFFSIALVGPAFVCHLERIASSLGLGTTLSMWVKNMWTYVDDRETRWKLLAEFDTSLQGSNQQWQMQFQQCKQETQPLVNLSVPGHVPSSSQALKYIVVRDTCISRIHVWTKSGGSTQCSNPFQRCTALALTTTGELKQAQVVGEEYENTVLELGTPLSAVEYDLLVASRGVYSHVLSLIGVRSRARRGR